MATTVETPARRARIPQAAKDWALAVILIAAGAAAIRLAHDAAAWFRMGWSERFAPKIAVISPDEGSVRFRLRQSAIWRDLHGGRAEASDGDSVFTGGDGRATLALGERGEAVLGPNTLVVVEEIARVERGWTLLESLIEPFRAIAPAPPVPVAIDLRQGSVRIKEGEAGRAKVRIQGNHALDLATLPSGAPIDLEIVKDGDSESVRIESPAMDAMVTISSETLTRGTTVRAGAGETATLTREGMEIVPQPVRDLAPSGRTVFLRPGLTPVEFSWTPIPAALPGPGGETKLEIAREGREGGDPFWVPVAPLSGKAMTWLEPGAYRWRMAGLVGAEGREKPFLTPWKSFRAVALAAPSVLGPAPGARVYAGRASAAAVSLSWGAPAPGLVVEAEVTTPAGPTVLEGRSGGAVAQLAAGNYTWRARSRARGTDEYSEWSEVRGFEVVAGARPARPVAEVSAAVAPEQAAVAAPGVLTAPTGAQVAAAAPVSPAPAPAPARPAKPESALEVRQVAPGGSPPERVADAWIEEGVVSVGTRAKGAGLSEGLPIQLEWKPIPGVKQYIVTLAEADGSIISKDTATTPPFRFNLDRLRDVRYSVAAKLPSGETVTSPPAPIRIMLSAPEAVKPVRGARVGLRASTVLSWEKTFFAEKYRVQVVRSDRLLDPVVDRTIPGNFTSFAPETPGRYLWRVKALSAKGESPWSPARVFLVK